MSPSILIVDDNPDQAKLVQRLFRGFGYESETADGGREGLRRAGELNPRLVILDRQMPDLDGEGVLQAIRDNRDLDGTAVVVLTGDGFQYEQRAVELGADGYIVKGAPNTFDLLREAVVKYVGDRSIDHDRGPRKDLDPELPPLPRPGTLPDSGHGRPEARLRDRFIQP